tara:strand:- start:2804 stop:4330 length:1527 start_codon:yes stop_codon:yes gene_type:complete
MNFDEYNNEINNLLKNFKKSIKQINILEKIIKIKGGSATNIPEWFKNSNTAKIPDLSSRTEYRQAIAGWYSRNYDGGNYNPTWLTKVNGYNFNLSTLNDLKNEWTRIGRPLTNGINLIYDEDDIRNKNKPETEDEYKKALTALKTRNDMQDEKLVNDAQSKVTEKYQQNYNLYENKTIDELEIEWNIKKPSIDGTGIIPETNLQYVTALSKSKANRQLRNFPNRNFKIDDQEFKKQFDVYKSFVEDTNPSQINIMKQMWREEGNPDTNGFTEDENKTKRYKITPTMKQPIKSTSTSIGESISTTNSESISTGESISTTNSESDLEIMKNKIRELLKPDSNLKIDMDKFKIIMEDIKVLKQKMLNLIKKLDDIKQNKENDILSVNNKIKSLIQEMNELGNTVNLNPEATKGQIIKGGSKTTSITENKIKNIGNTIEEIRLLLGDKTNQDKKIDLNDLNNNYDLFINNLQIFLNDFLKNKDQSSNINVEETNKKIQELSKSFEDLKLAFQ